MATLFKRSTECEILVVDDEEAICSLLETALGGLYKVKTCLNARTALSLIESHDFDVVIADINLPDMSGLDILRAARQKDDFTELLVITGFATLETAGKAIEIGVSSYLTKPLSIVDLQIQVEKAVATRLFHLKSIMLRKYSDTIAPDIQGHLNDITSLFHFSRKLMLSLEMSEVARIILEEINERIQTQYSVLAVHSEDINEIFAMPRIGSLDVTAVRQSIIDNWDKSCRFFSKDVFDKKETPITVFGGRHDEAVQLTKVKPVVFNLSVMDKNVGSLSLFCQQDHLPKPDDSQFLHVFTSFVAATIEHSCQDMHAKLQARTDGLTGILNHRSFHETLSREIARADRSETGFGLIIMDIDDFKKVNDTYGHLVGDAVIRNLVARVSAMIRRADTFARYGGEEFGLILPDTPIDGAKVLAGRICKEIAATPCRIGKLSVPYSVSLGLSIYKGTQPRQKDKLIDDADKALYVSKANGKSRYSVN